ncbi:hypothetical protein MBGDC06_00107 [Thermoplasmatales archaeon SCGC AB-539-C06]|nr:hypothetical protein MBGDC06_00107 [Thermoplasmatales archaeon SCGC AB-539-C06]
MTAQPAVEEFAKSETEEIPTRGSRIPIKKGMDTQKIEAWLKSEEKARREIKRIGKRIKITKKAVQKEIKFTQRLVKILGDDDAMYVRDKIEKKVYKSRRLEQRLNKHIKKLIEHFKILKNHFILNYYIKEKLKQIIRSLGYYYMLFLEFWEGHFGFERELREWTTDSLSALRRMFPIYLHNLIDLLGMLSDLDKTEKDIIEVEKQHYEQAKRTSVEKQHFKKVKKPAA